MISPSQCAEYKDRLVAKIEDIIDDILGRFYTGMPYIVNLCQIMLQHGDLTTQQLAELRKRYELAGWRVEPSFEAYLRDVTWKFSVP